MSRMIEGIVHEGRVRTEHDEYRVWMVPANTAVYFAINACLASIGFDDVLEGTGTLPRQPKGGAFPAFVLRFWHPHAQVGFKVTITAEANDIIEIHAEAWFPGSGKANRTSRILLAGTRDLFHHHKGFIYTSDFSLPTLRRMEEIRSQWLPRQFSSFVQVIHLYILRIVEPEVQIPTVVDPELGLMWDPLTSINAFVEFPGAALQTSCFPTPPQGAVQTSIAGFPGAGRQFLAFATTLVHVTNVTRDAPSLAVVVANIDALPLGDGLPWGESPRVGNLAFEIIRPDAMASFNVAGGKTIVPPEAVVVRDERGGDGTVRDDAAARTASVSALSADQLEDAKVGTMYVCCRDCPVCGGRELSWRRAVKRAEEANSHLKHALSYTNFKGTWHNPFVEPPKAPVTPAILGTNKTGNLPGLGDPAPAAPRSGDNVAIPVSGFASMTAVTPNVDGYTLPPVYGYSSGGGAAVVGYGTPIATQLQVPQSPVAAQPQQPQHPQYCQPPQRQEIQRPQQMPVYLLDAEGPQILQSPQVPHAVRAVQAPHLPQTPLTPFPWSGHQ